MKLHFLGACEEVGRSAVLVECGPHKILLDAGIKLGEEEDEFPAIDRELAGKIDAVILTHAHLDHCGFLPHLVAMGFKGKIFATKPTRDLCQLLLADYSRICKSENKKGFSQEDVLETIKRFSFLEYWKKTKIFNETFVTMYRAGHILGSAMIRLQCGEKSLLYTGDFSFHDSNLLNKADSDVEDFNALIIESTYGGKKDILPSIKSSSNKLAEIIKDTVKRNGKIVIPAFGVGRSQEIMIIVDNYVKSGAIPRIPCYVDGMIKKSNRIYRHNVLWLKEEIPKRILLAQDDPFESDVFETPKTKDRSDVFRQENALIISTSGMLTGGPVLHYLERLAGDEKNTLILVGYQAENTLGRELVDGHKTVILPNKKEINVKMRVEKLNFSAHADYPQIIDFMKKIPKPKHVFIVHGEKEKMVELKSELNRYYKTTIPKLKEEHMIE